MGFPGPLLFYVLIGLVVLAVWWAQRQATAKKVAEALAVAARYGFEVDVSARSKPYQPFDLFDVGRSQQVSFRFWRPGRQDSVFEYRYTTGSGKNKHTHHHTCALVELPFDAPHTKIGPEGFWSGIGRAVGIRDIEVETPAFNDRFKVDSDDERFAVTMLDGRAIDWFLRADGVNGVRFELWDRWMLCITGRMDLDRALGFHDWSVAIPPHLPDVLVSLYPRRG